MALASLLDPVALLASALALWGLAARFKSAGAAALELCA